MTTLYSSENYSKQNYSKFLELVNLKKTNTVFIKDLLNSNNVDLKMLKQAKNTQDFINYKLSKFNITKTYRLPLVNVDLSSIPDKQDSKFVRFNLFNDINHSKKSMNTIKNFKKMSKTPLRKDLNSYNFNTSDYYSSFKPQDKKESYCDKIKNPKDVITPLGFYDDDTLYSCGKNNKIKSNADSKVNSKANNNTNNKLNDDNLEYQYIDEQEYEQVEDGFLLFNPIIKKEMSDGDYNPYSEY